MSQNDYEELVLLAKDVTLFGFEFMQDGVLAEHFNNIVHRNAVLLFCHIQAELDGVITLLQNPQKLQPNTAQLQLRSMFESWLAISLMASTDGIVWSRYLEVTSKQRTIKRAKELHNASAITKKQLDEIVTNMEFMVNNLGEQFDLPVMQLFAKPVSSDPELDSFQNEIKLLIQQSKSSRKTQLVNQLTNIINSKHKKPRDFVRKPLGVLEMCQAVDYYYPLKEAGISHVQWYDRIYSHLSDYAHVDLSNASASLNIDENSITSNIAGNADFSPRLLRSAIVFYLGSLEHLAGILLIDINNVMKSFDARLSSLQ